MSQLSSDAFSEASLPQLDLFSLPPTMTSIERIHFEDYRPVSQISNSDTPIDFQIKNGGSEYLDLRRSRLYVKGKLVNDDGTDIAEGKKVGPVQLLLHSLWSQIDVTLGDKLVSVSTNTYSYKAYFQTLMAYGEGAKRGQLSAQLWATETGTNLDGADPSKPGENTGFKERYEVAKESTVFDMEGTLACDIFQIAKYLISGVDVTLKFFRNRPAFYLMAAEVTPNFHFEILDIVFRVCKVTVSNSVILAHNAALSKAPARYPYKRRYCKMATISAGHVSYVWDNAYNSFCPTRILVAITSAQATGGNVALNPYKFSRSQVASITLYVNGQTTPGRPIRLTDTTYVTAYDNLFDSWGLWGRDSDLGIGREDYLENNAIYGFEIEPLSSSEEYLSLLRTANIRIEIVFATPLQTALSVILYGEFPALIEIDKSRAVYLVTAS